MITFVLLIIGMVGCLAALGRLVIPPAERLPWWAWTRQDLAANVARGAGVLAELSRGQQRLWELHRHHMLPPHRPPERPDGRTR